LCWKVQLDFQSSAAAWKHADVMAYHALLFAHYHVPVHTIIILLRPEAAHVNMNGLLRYAPRPGRGRMEFGYEVARLWERPAEELLQADLGVAPLAVLGRLTANVSQEDGLTLVARRLAERITKEAPADRARKLLTDAYLLTGLRLRRDAAARIFRGVRAMQESDTYLAILDEGQEKAMRESILLFGEGKFGARKKSTGGLGDIQGFEGEDLGGHGMLDAFRISPQTAWPATTRAYFRRRRSRRLHKQNQSRMSPFAGIPRQTTPFCVVRLDWPMVLINDSSRFASCVVSGLVFGVGFGGIDSQQFVHELRRPAKGGLAKCRERYGQG